jgi:hypothetical protein
MERITLIERSLKCFVLGLLALLPVVGVPFACAALFAASGTLGKASGEWNPARRYVLVGLWCAALGVAVSALGVSWIGIAILRDLGY